MRVALSFTGGKDSVLAAHLVCSPRFREPWNSSDVLEHVVDAVDGRTTQVPLLGLSNSSGILEVVALVTFAPPRANDQDDDDDRGFKAHPLRLVRAQAAALAAGIAATNASTTPAAPHLLIDIAGPDYAASYSSQLAKLREPPHRIEALVTGDVLDVCNGFMAKACARAGVRLVTPLWQQPRPRILNALHTLGIRSLITCVNVSKFPAGESRVDPVAELLGKELTREVWQEEGGALHRLQGVVDLCGEGGEFHTAAFEAPLFEPRALRVQVTGHAFKGADYAHVVLGDIG